MNRILVFVVALGAAWLAGGCGTSGKAALVSVDESRVLESELPTAAYTSADGNSADVYLTDLPPRALDPGADLAEVSGQLVHIHIFLVPKAGSTPIEQTACSATVRVAVVSHGEVGIYGGGAFLQPSGTMGEDTISGSVSKATCRLIAASPGFDDLLGASTFRASFEAQRSVAASGLLANRLAELREIALTPAPTPK